MMSWAITILFWMHWIFILWSIWFFIKTVERKDEEVFELKQKLSKAKMVANISMRDRC
jgi:hypothetical protein